MSTRSIDHSTEAFILAARAMFTHDSFSRQQLQRVARIATRMMQTHGFDVCVDGYYGAVHEIAIVLFGRDIERAEVALHAADALMKNLHRGKPTLVGAAVVPSDEACAMMTPEINAAAMLGLFHGLKFATLSAIEQTKVQVAS